MDKNKIISAIVVGAAVTAGITLLFATERGKTVVKKITEKKDSVKESTIESVVNFLFSMIDKLTTNKNVNADKRSNNRHVTEGEEVLA